VPRYRDAHDAMFVRPLGCENRDGVSVAVAVDVSPEAKEFGSRRLVGRRFSSQSDLRRNGPRRIRRHSFVKKKRPIASKDERPIGIAHQHFVPGLGRVSIVHGDCDRSLWHIAPQHLPRSALPALDASCCAKRSLAIQRDDLRSIVTIEVAGRKQNAIPACRDPIITPQQVRMCVRYNRQKDREESCRCASHDAALCMVEREAYTCVAAILTRR
jgi:hypothetical protein